MKFTRWEFWLLMVTLRDTYNNTWYFGILAIWYYGILVTGLEGVEPEVFVGDCFDVGGGGSA